MKNFWKYFDKLTFIVLITTTVFGIFLIYSASYTTDTSYFNKQIAWFAISLICFFLVFKIKTETLFRWRLTIFIVLLACLSILLLAGIITSGVRSWFRIGFMSILKRLWMIILMSARQLLPPAAFWRRPVSHPAAGFVPAFR